MTDRSPRRLRAGLAISALTLAAACGGTMDLDMRGDFFATSLDTSEAAQAAAEGRPRADERGVISYPQFQVALARRGDTVQDVANRVGVPAEELARYNGLRTDTQLRQGEVLSLPRRVAELSSGAVVGGPIAPTDNIDITTLAGDAITRAGSATPQPGAPQTAPAQTSATAIQHQVRRGETAYSIARLYNVSVRSLADWNALDSALTVREGQFLLVPPTTQMAAAPAVAETAPETVAPPGTGSPTPTPPSASQPLPAETAVTAPAPPPSSPNLAEERTAVSATGRLSMPVRGSIIAEYERGRNEGIDIAAPAGTPVTAAGAGTVAAITRDTDQVPILVLRHQGNLLTVYANIDDIAVEKGDSVSAGQTIARVRAGDPSFLHFEVREGFESADPMEYLN